MQVKCPHCLHSVDVADSEPGPSISCPDCHHDFDIGAVAKPALPARRSAPRALARRPPPGSFDLDEEEEEHLERREERLERYEERDERHDQRLERKEQNGLAMVGFTFSVTSLVLVSGGLLFAKEMTFYLGCTLFFGFPGALAGILFSLLGCIYRKKARWLGIAGVVIGSVLLLGLIPLGFLMLKKS